jgi:uncharacterized protein (DUF362 family)
MLTRRALLALPAALALEPAKSRVVVARDAAARGNSAKLLALLDRAVQAVYGRDNPIEAWKQIARPGEMVGLKVNCLAGRGSASTNPVLVEAVSERLQQAGIPAGNILIFDRLSSDLESAGFRIADRSGRIRTLGNDQLGYEDELAVSGSAASLVARALTRVCAAVINLPVLKDHGIAGVTMALKNMFGAIHNPNKYHVNVGDPYVADVYALPAIRQKVRLAICDATIAQYEGGPSFMPQWTWPAGRLLASRDPVALDYVGWQMIERQRAALGLKSLAQLKRQPAWIATAADAAHQLGTSDPQRIERVEV